MPKTIVIILFVIALAFPQNIFSAQKYKYVSGTIQMVENEPFAHLALFSKRCVYHIEANSIILSNLGKLQGKTVRLYYSKKVKELKKVKLFVNRYKQIIH